MMMSSGPDPQKQEYSVDQRLIGEARKRVFRMYQTHQWPKSVKGIEYFTEQIFTVNPEGLFERIEIKEGIVGSQSLTSTQTEVYEYDVSIQEIRPPIK